MFKTIESIFKKNKNLQELDYRQLIDFADDGVWAIDKDSNTIFVSEAMSKMLGYKVKEMLGKHLFSFMEAQFIEKCKRYISNRKNGVNEKHDFEFLHKNGSKIFTLVRTVSLLNKDGSYFGAIAIVSDITSYVFIKEQLINSNSKLLKTREELELSEEKFRKVFYCSTEMMFLSSLETGVIIDVNDEVLRVLGYQRWELLGNTSFYLNLWVDIADRENLINLLEANGVVRNYSVRFKSKFGKILSVSIAAEVISINSQMCILVSARDVTELKIYEQSLKFSEEKFSKVFSSNGVAMILSELHDGLIVDVNNKFMELYGFSRNEIVGKYSLDVKLWFFPEEREKLVDLLNKQGCVRNFEVKSRVKSGKILTIDLTSDIVIFGGKKYILSCCVDVTQKKQLEERLLLSEEKFSKAFMFNADVMTITSLETGEFMEVNEAAKNVFGYEREELIGKNVFDVKFWKDVESRKIFLKRLKTQGSVRLFDMNIVDKLGREIIVSVSSDLMRIGEREFLITSYRDITKIKEDEIRLMNERLRLSNVIKGTNAGTWEWNVQTGETIFNEVWANLLGYTLEELAPISIKTWEALTCPEDLKLANEQLVKHFNGDSLYYNCEFRMKHKDGHWVWIQDRGQVISWTSDGKPLWMFGTHIDITERKCVEAQLKESRDQLEKKNIALKEVISNIEKEKESLKNNFKANLEQLLLPQIERMKKKKNNREDKKIDLLKNSIVDMGSSFGVSISNLNNRLTSREIEICSYIKSGLSSKEISQNLNISLFSLHTHRKNIRRKLELSHSKINLSTYLLSL